MKLKLNKKQLKNLSLDNKALPMHMTPKIGGGLADGGDLTGRLGDPNSLKCRTTTA